MQGLQKGQDMEKIEGEVLELMLRHPEVIDWLKAEFGVHVSRMLDSAPKNKLAWSTDLERTSRKLESNPPPKAALVFIYLKGCLGCL